MMAHIGPLAPLMVQAVIVDWVVGVCVVVRMVRGMVVRMVVSVVVCVVVVIVMSGTMIGAMVSWPMVVIIVVTTCTSAKTLAEGEFGRQLPDGLPLVKNGLFLPHKALTQVEDSCFGLIRNTVAHHWPVMSIAMSVTMAITMSISVAVPMATRAVAVPWREARRVCVCRNWGADKFWVGTKVVLQPRYTADNSH